MSTLHHEDLLLSIFEEVQEAFPYLDEDKQIEIANNRFWGFGTMTFKDKKWEPHIKNGITITFMYTSQQQKSKYTF